MRMNFICESRQRVCHGNETLCFSFLFLFFRQFFSTCSGNLRD
ncbi:CLUMA_CG000772, isoform A [Clunio marinus]|uniref:CLUMA_CG000772, isoform A n=1 Tax=Clunio marinus TaxID=568069 RepID=A0A1J1HHR4_9DIPT|nr:CLUMA_CG000772, isoform A [Clunio marinus]